MRSVQCGVTPGISRRFAPEKSLELFRRIGRSRFFELEVVKACEQGRITCPVYLSLGQESVPAAVSLAAPGAMLFTQHRCHAWYLAFGGPPEKLRDELLGAPGGTSGGRAGSNCVQCHTEGLTMFGHHGLIGENVPQAVGAALGSGRLTVCVFGDGAAEEDYVYPSLGFAVTHRLPVLFVCEDNDLSILTPTSARRSWKLTDVAAGLGMPCREISDDPWAIADSAAALISRLPALMNVHVCRRNWHVGTGTDGPAEWDRYELVQRELIGQGLGPQQRMIEQSEKEAMQRLWAP
jgi:pyruvate dehydrogenase E1 component alpha subunit